MARTRHAARVARSARVRIAKKPARAAPARARALPGDVVVQRFLVPFEYPVVFTRRAFDPDNRVMESLLARACDDGAGPVRALAYLDDGVAAAWPGLARRIDRYLTACRGVCRPAGAPELVPGGERTKNGWNVVQNIMARIGNAHLCRHSVVVAVGGGSVLDMVGFAASLVHRGVRLIRVPTSVLAQCDGGVGVKNGMDEHGMKNFVGTFAPPFAVVNDFAFLRTLPDRYWLGGIAEAFKVAVIKDAAFFEQLRRAAAALRGRSARHIERVIRRAATLHMDHIAAGGDPFETGTARPLDFGHWAAHKLEILSNYRLSHGEAVAVGVALDTCIACRRGLLTPRERDMILGAMEAAGLPLWSDAAAAAGPDGAPALLAGLEEFREHLGGRLTVTLPRGIGARIEVHEIDAADVRACMGWLSRRPRTA